MRAPDAPAEVRRLLARDGRTVPARAMGAFNAVAAHVVTAAGMDALWLSGLELSASKGLPDTNVITTNDLCEAAVVLRTASDLPVIVDVDNAGGSLSAAGRYARELSMAGVGAVCIEDSAYPKCNSFSENQSQSLAETALTVGQIATIRQTAETDLVIIARTEVLICGGSIDEAVARAGVFAEAGADAVLIHTKDRTGGQALAVADRWDHRVPLVTVPTAFPDISPARLGQAGFRLAIYANQLSRVALASMRQAMEDFVDHGIFDKTIPMATMSDLMKIGDAAASAGV